MSHLREKLSDTSSGSSLKGILKKEEPKSRTKSSSLRFDDSSLSKIYIFDMEDPGNVTDVLSLSSQDIPALSLDYPDLSPSEEQLKKIREARLKEFRMKRKKHHHNEFVIVKSSSTFDDEDMESNINALSLGQERT